jgi:hypothetical protein
MTPRERSVRAARKLLSDQRLASFFHAIRDSGVSAAAFMGRHLDGGESLDDIFYTGNEFGYTLSVRRRSGASFDITFGYQAAPLAGDGGEWCVSFDGDRVRSLHAGSEWIS